MKPIAEAQSIGRERNVIPAMALLLSLFVVCPPAGGKEISLEEYQTAGQIRELTREQAARQNPVRLQGVVTFFDQKNFFRFMQDSTAGIYFYLDASSNNPPLAAGQLIELVGEVSPGEYAPIVIPSRIEILGTGTFPAPKPVTFEQLVSGQEDSQFVETHGIVRAVHYDQESGYFQVEMATGGGRLTAYASKLPVTQSSDLVDRIVTVRGVCVTRFNRQRQLFDIRLLVPRPTDLVVDSAEPSDPFATPARPIQNLLQFTPQSTYGHRVKVVGTVIYRQNDDSLYIEDQNEGLYVETKQAGPLSVGDQVEVLGFPAKGDYTPMLQDAIFRKIGTYSPPQPDIINVDEALMGTHDCRLVRIDATVLDRTRRSGEQFLVLQAPGGFIFHAYLEGKNGEKEFADLQNGSKVSVTGVCLIEIGGDWQAGAAWRAKSFRILMRSPADVVVLQRPPWWNLQKLLWAVGVLGVVVVGAFAWVAVLRRRVHKQTGIIREKLQTEAALKERYEDLFENANDIIFTHDLKGHITSINKIGEQVLQRSRQEILSKRLVEFVAEEQQAAAEQWLNQVVKGAEIPAVELDFIGRSGQRIRLEIGARMIEQAGKQIEVESIARDITERKRLEKEILEISNREQRRIGHDLHDGVCQQLAGIAYRIDILADQLQEKGARESAEAERVGALVNDAITKTRGVARGLFPVQLEENGLVWALEDLAANAGNLFGIQCSLSCEEPFPAVENDVALHLFYIAQEAMINAAKHGKARQVNISLTRQGERLALTVQDDGSGFESPAGNSTGMGIRIMRYRARVIGATLDLTSRPGLGTQVACVFYSAPRKAREAAAGPKTQVKN
ncbi:MAG TPA: PAS domain-containing sensor histidine kinase [Candidatus Acidoferrum sp.]|nr:PAS domain-containing sensor histidine kinase [Candidatus Acidoferrum sp.]